jgi:hypothetical protein
MDVEYIENELLRIVEELDPECPDAGAYLDGHCSIFELVMWHCKEKHNPQIHTTSTKDRMGGFMNISIKENPKEECFNLVDTDSDQSHDGDGAKELIAKVYEERWARIIQHAIMNRLVSCK